jgi:hypothetical protein
MMPDITPQRKEAFRDKAGQLGGLTFPCPTHHRRRDRSSIPLGCTAGVEVLEPVFSAPGLGFVLGSDPALDDPHASMDWRFVDPDELL